MPGHPGGVGAIFALALLQEVCQDSGSFDVEYTLPDASEQERSEQREWTILEFYTNITEYRTQSYQDRGVRKVRFFFNTATRSKSAA